MSEINTSKILQKGGKKEFRCNSLFLTYSQVKDDEFMKKIETISVMLKCEKFIACREKHQQEGVHYHAYFKFQGQERPRIKPSDLDIGIYHANIQYADKNVVGYIMKDAGKYAESYIIQYGFTEKELKLASSQYQKSQQMKNSRLMTSKHDKQALTNAKYYELISGKVKLDDFVYKNPFFVTKYGNIKSNLNLFFNDLYKNINRFELFYELGLRNYWIYGDTGVGKSYVSHRLWPNHYIKLPTNKWFDGYEDQTTIIVEERNDKSFTESLLRLISDSYSISVEIKGSYVVLRHFRVVVLSKKKIADFYTEAFDAENLKNIKRRFVEIDADANIGANGYFTIKDYKLIDFEAFHLTEKNCKDLGFDFLEIYTYGQKDPIQIKKREALREFEEHIAKTFERKMRLLKIDDPFCEKQGNFNKNIEKIGAEEIPYIDIENEISDLELEDQKPNTYDNEFINDEPDEYQMFKEDDDVNREIAAHLRDMEFENYYLGDIDDNIEQPKDLVIDADMLDAEDMREPDLKKLETNKKK